MARLLAAAPPAVRWRALRELSDNRASLQAMTVHELLPEDGSRRGLSAVARSLGVTASWVSQLATLPRRHAGMFAWGRALGLAGELVALAERPGSSRLSDEFAALVQRGLHDTSPRADLENAASRWAMAARRQRRGPEADALVERIDTLLTDVDPALDLDWLARAEIALGYQSTRASSPPRPAATAWGNGSGAGPLGPARPVPPLPPTPPALQPPPASPPAAAPRQRRGPDDPLPWSRYRLRDR
ncbi:hypothetical protein I6A84_11155 [Frankia sp. CNm7]|uniref:Uncharacterized protein n=1 Tax=Frankia nepalensis TaxID=1836974 RepID=A0A937URA1_9ACTN|nr:hypothetical protein [Frankia nepalensis]MBL7510231.1 hypothetical protein [Frankia nepalensis]MBL7518653.1 hypothetical protein [Frankia nepalensis]MBL7630943.1 hypothetical protein [Frankia nepalensis]